MPVTPWVPAVTRVRDGQDVSAAVVNPIFAQHTQREQYLYEKFNELANKSVLVAFDQLILPSANPEMGPATVVKNTVVFYEKEIDGDVVTEGIAAAKVDFAPGSINTTAYTPANSAYSMGIVKEISVDGDKADVFLLGLVEFDDDMNNTTDGIIQTDERIEDDEDFEPGPFFLSRTEAGRITRNPGGVAIFIGYALNRTKLLLSPDVSEFNQFFTAYRFNILDRPANKPIFIDDAWTLDGASAISKTKVGWVPATEDYVPDGVIIPDGAKFFYNIPSNALVDLDSGITLDERASQKDLAATLPPNPVNFTLLTVNGIIQANRDLDTYGPYIITESGLWWYDDADSQQPWANDVPTRVEVGFTISSEWIDVVGNHTFILGDIIRFETDDTLPTGLLVDTDYFVVDTRDSNADDLLDQIQVSDTNGGTPILFSDVGVSSHYIPQPYIWKFASGADAFRPKMLLQFLKFNPSLTEAIVTSLKKYNPASNAIRFFKPDRVTESTRGTGDLLARVVLTYVAGTALATAGTAINSISYAEETGLITTVSAPSVSKIIEGDGISISEISVGGVIQPGSFLISSTLNSQTGKVSYLEPDGAELIYDGLHSYLNMPYPTVLPSSFIAKIVLPSGIPIADMSLRFMMVGGTTLGPGATNRAVAFDFSYAITKPGSTLGAASTPTVVSFNIPLATAGYTKNTCFKVGAGLTASTYSIPLTSLIIPATTFSGDSIVNFKLSRAVVVSNPYVSDLGIVDMYWKIG